jgi:hypothetical protein
MDITVNFVQCEIRSIKWPRLSGERFRRRALTTYSRIPTRSRAKIMDTRARWGSCSGSADDALLDLLTFRHGDDTARCQTGIH